MILLIFCCSDYVAKLTGQRWDIMNWFSNIFFFSFYTSKISLNSKKIPWLWILHLQNYFWMSTSGNQNMLPVDFQKLKYIIRSRLSKVKIYYQKSTFGNQKTNSIFNIFNFIWNLCFLSLKCFFSLLFIILFISYVLIFLNIYFKNKKILISIYIIFLWYTEK